MVLDLPQCLFKIKVFSIIVICVSNSVFLKDIMDESTPLTDDECLIPDIDEGVVISMSILRSPQNYPFFVNL